MAETSAATLWDRPASGTRGPKRTHSRDAIATAAITLADADGPEAVSMRSTAQLLGTSASALYRYVASRDELLELMADAALADLVIPPHDSNPMNGLVLVARAQRDLFRLHPWLPGTAGRASALGPRALAFFETCLAILAPLSCATAAKFEAIAVLTGLASLFARDSEQGDGNPATLFAGMRPATHPYLVAELTAPSRASAGVDLFERTVRGALSAVLAA
jgi:AcrR family transcriptional regulator